MPRRLRFALAIVASLVWNVHAFCQVDPLPSWNEGPAKKAIVEFVQATTTQGSASFVATVTVVYYDPWYGPCCAPVAFGPGYPYGGFYTYPP